MKKLLLIAALGLAPAALAIPPALEAQLDQKSGKVIAESQAYHQLVRQVKSSMAMDKASSPSDQDTQRLVKAMTGVKDSIGDLLALLTAHASELKPDDKDYDTFVAGLQARNQDLTEAIAELEPPPVRALLPASAFIVHHR